MKTRPVAGHALEIATLPRAQQKKALKAVFRIGWHNGKDTRVEVTRSGLKSY